MTREGADVWALDDEHPTQFGGVREYDRTTPVSQIVAAGVAWAIGDIARVCKDIGIQVSDITDNLMVFFVDGVTPAGVNDARDPLHMSVTRRKAPAVYSTVTVGWKFMVVTVGYVPDHESVLKEGVSPVRSKG